MSGKSRKGQSIIETVVGIMFLVPIVLFLFDIAVLVLCNTANDNLAKSACRAAASATDDTGAGGKDGPAFTAANNVAKNFAESAIIKHTTGDSFLTGFSYNADGTAKSGEGTWPGTITGNQPAPPEPVQGQVACITSMKVIVPVPFPFLPTQWDFQSKDVEPIVSIAP